jgi:hypothetical protein
MGISQKSRAAFLDTVVWVDTRHTSWAHLYLWLMWSVKFMVLQEQEMVTRGLKLITK